MGISVVVGSNRGIGLEVCKQLLAKGETVIAACRKRSPELDALGVEVVAGVDVTDDAKVAVLSKALEGKSIDQLFVVAGVFTTVGLDSMSFDAIGRELEINAIGPLRVTHALLPHLGRGAKVALLTSRMGSIEDNSSGGQYAYRMSKAALNMAGRSLAHDLQSRGIAVALLHPGFVRTDMTGGAGMIDPDESAAGLLARVADLDLETSGGFWHQNGERLPW